MKNLQIRNVPDSVHRTLKARAAMAGMSLSEYSLAHLRRAAEQPTNAEIIERLRRRPRRSLKESPAEIIRAARDAR